MILGIEIELGHFDFVINSRVTAYVCALWSSIKLPGWIQTDVLAFQWPISLLKSSLLISFVSVSCFMVILFVHACFNLFTMASSPTVHERTKHPIDTALQNSTILCLILALIGISLRLYVRKFIVKTVATDDWILLAGFVSPRSDHSRLVRGSRQHDR